MHVADSNSAHDDRDSQAPEALRAQGGANSESTPTSETDSNGVDLSFLDTPVEVGDLGRIAHYRVMSILGIGGMGVVLRGEDTHLRRPVALKVMRREYLESYASRERFLQEARIAAAVESENIVTVYQVGLHNDVPFLAMQFLHGEALDERLNRSAPLPIPFALLIARQTAAGLADAHAHGLVHRDIKPANIWLETDPATQKFRRVRLLDFGLARIVSVSTKLTNTGIIVGTPQYMSPEQAFGSDVDSRADLFSLGAVMYAMFTGKLPFDGPSSATVLMALAAQHPIRATKLNRLVPPEVDELIDRLLAKEPDQRPASANEVVEILDSVLIDFSAPILGRTSGSLGYPVRSDTLRLSRTPRTTLSVERPIKIATVEASEPTLPHPTPSPISSSKLEPSSLRLTPSLLRDAEDPTAVVEAVFPLPVQLPLAEPQAARPALLSRISWINVIGWSILVALTSFLALGGSGRRDGPTNVASPLVPQEIRVGVLYSKSGSMAALEHSLADAVMLAVNELNQSGGVLGRKVVPVESDAGQTPEEAVHQAELLVNDRGVTTIFGSSSPGNRRTIRPLIERFNAVLFCPGLHEGMEESARIVYFGPSAAQVVTPSIDYLASSGHRRFFIVGQDVILSRVAGAITRDLLAKATEATLVDEVYVPLGSKDFTPMIQKIQAAAPDVIVSAFRGGNSVLFLQQLRAAQPSVTARVLHLQDLEDFHRAIDPETLRGDMIASTLSNESASVENSFANRFRARYGANRVITDSMVDAYGAVKLWAQAVERAQSDAPNDLLAALPKDASHQPILEAASDATGRHFRFPVFITNFGGDGTPSVVFHQAMKDVSIYPPSRSSADWDRMLRQLYFRWGERWRGP